MLNVIEPQEQDFYKHTINSYLNLLKIYQNFELSSEDKSNATFIIAEDEGRGVYGGALLYQRQVTSLHEKIAKIILSFQPERQEVWGGLLCFCVEDNESVFTLNTLDLYQSFYQNLYRAFVTFGEQKNLDFLAITLRYKDYRNIRTYGHWPYLLEVPPHDTPDSYFHGLLDVGNKKGDGLTPLQHSIALCSGQSDRSVL
ncbi:MAG: hypothetical protein ACP5OE_09165 [Thermodesulfobium sp.]